MPKLSRSSHLRKGTAVGPACSFLQSSPPEVVDNICSHMDVRSLSQTRLVNHYLSEFATSWLFREVKFSTYPKIEEREAIINIAQSAKLSRLVRKVVCTAYTLRRLPFFPHLDSSFQDTLRTLRPKDLYCIAGAVYLLPLIACFRNLKSLDVSFDTLHVHTSVDPHRFQNMNFKSMLVAIILQSLAGTWTLQRQEAIDKVLRVPTKGLYPGSKFPVPTSEPIALKVLKLREMDVNLDPRVTRSVEFETIMGSGGVVDFGLHEKSFMVLDNRIPVASFYEMRRLENLPKVWFVPDVAENLRTLSLEFGYNWGWHPKVDLETIPSKFPNLTELRLFKFIISHERQVEWMASLGKSSRSGGLERLVLYNCAILYAATHHAPLDFDENGVGYLNKESIVTSPSLNGGALCSYFPLRWYTIFEVWQQTMTALTSFQINNVTDEDPISCQGGLGLEGGFLEYASFRQNGPETYNKFPKDHVGLPYDEAAFCEHVEQLISRNRRVPVGPCVARDEQAAARFSSLVNLRK